VSARTTINARFHTSFPKGESITTLAFDFGYESASAFATMFKRVMGVAPSRYFGSG